MKTYKIRTEERVEGIYTVIAKNEDDARKKLEFAKKGGRRIDWENVTQNDYQAWDLDIETIAEIE